MSGDPQGDLSGRPITSFSITGWKVGGKEYLQGDIVPTHQPFLLRVRVIGTAPIQQIEIIRSQQFIHTRQSLKTEDAFTFSDNQPLPGESYYYVRGRQVDGQMA